MAVITGGDGIARATALRFAAEGARIVGADIVEDKMRETARLVADAGGEMTYLATDLMDETAVNRLMKFAETTYGGIDVLAHFAMDLRVGDLPSVSVEDFTYTLTRTATMTFLVSKHAVPFLMARGGGSIVLAGSQSGSLGAGFLGNTGHLFSYSVGKGAVIRLGVVLANVLGKHGIRVNIVSPGPVATPNAVAFFGEEGSSERSLLVDSHMLLGRISFPEDVAGAALFLASDEASNITGQNLHVDGGMTASGGMGLANEEAQQIYDAMVPRADGTRDGSSPNRNRRRPAKSKRVRHQSGRQ
ncbi:SDR family NAD(P)-dependent oxidoreductase [Sphingobium fuliginis]|uniref:SDR family NAD(P)-dependent oxidoreductase n=1 Tax=Sphingobium fuliginis (strain ATCC 27551) TaxID=336203 RepID=UPI00142F8EC4|nr:SDR family oxidoreductase [Sphingobium fuliginis]